MQQLGDHLLGILVVAGNEHVGLATGQRRVDHDLSQHDVERLHHPSVRSGALHPLPKGVGGADEQAGPSGGEVKRVAGVDEDFGVETVKAG